MYALYERNFKMGVFLIALLLVEFGVVVGTCVSGIHALEFTQNTTCLPRRVPFEVIYLR